MVKTHVNAIKFTETFPFSLPHFYLDPNGHPSIRMRDYCAVVGSCFEFAKDYNWELRHEEDDEVLDVHYTVTL